MKPLCNPTRPAITTTKKSETESRREVKTFLKDRIRNRSKRGYE